MTEEVDKAKSWVINSNKVGVKLVPTHWSPGYTADHKATKEQAIAAGILKRQNEIIRLGEEIKTLYKLEIEETVTINFTVSK